MPDRLSYSIFETADALGISSDTVRRMVRRGDLPHFRVGKRVLIPADALRSLVGAA